MKEVRFVKWFKEISKNDTFNEFLTASFTNSLFDKKLVLTILAKDSKGSLASVPLFCDAVVEV